MGGWLRLIAVLWLCAMPCDLFAADEPVATRVQAIVAEHARAMSDFTRAYMAGGTSENRERIARESYPPVAPCSEQLLAIARQHPADPATFDALQWIVAHDGPGPRFEDASMLLAGHFTRDPRAASVALVFMNSTPNSAAAEAFLSSTISQNPDRDTKGIASYALARIRQKRVGEISDADPNPNAVGLKRSRIIEVEVMLRTIQSEYADVAAGPQFTLGKSADEDLFELHSPLAIGRVVPEISGQDIDGRPMKLSAFRGKVVMLDFWGDW
ncbi:MAG TPA: hypothetical protein VLI90_12485 [Tepidisphaeraceae bacterium]|nr:hypothetical protein [Tepidisphaeraceae bacterium]